MSGHLEQIEVENFKSYRGKVIIPFKRFTAIIGPNGSGKSNLMDAISFVLGEKTSSLRVKKLSDLIHGAPVGKPVSNRAKVSAIYVDENDERTCYSRSIKGSSAEHRVNTKVVSHQEYAKEMAKINIFIKVKNFLVFQGQVESIAMKNPKERTSLFEEISGSVEFKEDYEKLKNEMQNAEQATQFSYLRKKDIAAERKEARVEKEEAEKYQKLHEDYIRQRQNLVLFKLYHNEKEHGSLVDKMSSRQKEVRNLQKKRDRMEEDVKSRKQEHGQIMREVSSIEKQIQEKENDLNKKRPLYIKAKENTNFHMKRLEAAKKSLRTAESRHESHQHVIRDLEQQLNEIDMKQKEFEAQVEVNSQQEGRDMELEESQILEYNKLKEEAAKRSTAINTEIEKLQREQLTDQAMLDSERRKKNELLSMQKQKTKELDEAMSRVNKLRDYIKSSKQTLQDHLKLKDELENEVQSSCERIREINVELEEVMQKQGVAKVDRTENSRQLRKAELLDNLKRLFPGVYGRVLDLCEPIHNRYKIAITKVLGRYMSAIVCDSEKTARDCIQYMKEQCSEPETFLPLDYIEDKPINDKLREISEPANVKLVIDVIRYNPPIIRRALQFACGNSLVCETPEDARKVAFGQVARHKDIFARADGTVRRNQAVALDGTMFQKSGVISGGAMDLKKKAQRWDEKVLDQLRAKKENLTEELKQEMKKKRKEADLKNIVIQIGGLENRIKFSENDLRNTESRSMKEHSEKIQQLEQQLQNFEPRFMEIEERMQVREKEISNYKSSMNEVEDDVFRTFCVQIGVSNIRVYEESELKRQQQTMQKRLEYDNQRSRITNQLEYENSMDTMQNVRKWQDMILQDESNISQRKIEERKTMGVIQEVEHKLQTLKNSKIAKRKDGEEKTSQVEELRKDSSRINREATQSQKGISAVDMKLDSCREARHNLLQQCRLEGIDIPLKKGSLDVVDTEMDGESQPSSQNMSAIYDKEQEIEIKYSALSYEMKSCELDEVQHMAEKLQSQMNDLNNTIQRVAAPSMAAMSHLDEVKNRYHETKDEFDNMRKRARKAKQDYELIKRKRCEKFNQCSDYISARIDNIYKELSRNSSAQAHIYPDNQEEPYLEGITYNCVAPGKRFRPMDNLSGGEKTVAALSLIFAIRDYQPSPFFVLDEIDAALDNTNIGKVADYIQMMSNSVQCIVISLKEEFYSKADALIGIYPEQIDGCIASKSISLDLSCFPDPVEQ